MERPKERAHRRAVKRSMSGGCAIRLKFPTSEVSQLLIEEEEKRRDELQQGESTEWLIWSQQSFFLLVFVGFAKTRKKANWRSSGFLDDPHS